MADYSSTYRSSSTDEKPDTPMTLFLEELQRLIPRSNIVDNTKGTNSDISSNMESTLKPDQNAESIIKESLELQKSERTNNYTVSCGFAFLKCQCVFSPQQQNEWITHTISHFTEIPPLLDAKCNQCHHPFGHQNDAREDWVSRLNHCWTHFFGLRASFFSRGGSLEAFLREDALLDLKEPRQVYRIGKKDGYGSGYLFSSVVTLLHGEVYDAPSRRKGKKDHTGHKRAIISPPFTTSRFSESSRVNENFTKKHDSPSDSEEEIMRVRDWLSSSSLREKESMYPASFKKMASAFSIDGTTLVSTAKSEAGSTTTVTLGEARTTEDHKSRSSPSVITDEEQPAKTVSSGNMTPLVSSAASTKDMSMTSSTCSDETDWDGVSSTDSGVDRVNSHASPIQDGVNEGSLFRRQMTSAQIGLVNRLMEEFWVIFNQRWTSGIRQRGAESADFQGSSDQISADSSWETAKGMKRARGSDDGDSVNEKDRPSKRKGKEPAAPETSTTPLRFACPYRKHNPRRCKDLFNSEAELDAHIEAIISCQSKTSDPVDGITSKIKTKLQSRKKTHSRQTESERWIQIYEILFQPKPEDIIPSPYFEPIRDNECELESTLHHRDFANYEAYLRRELPRMFNTVLERVVSTETNPIEERLKDQLHEMIEEAQNRAFANWRAQQNSEQSDTSAPEAGDSMYLPIAPTMACLPTQTATKASSQSVGLETKSTDNDQTGISTDSGYQSNNPEFQPPEDPLPESDQSSDQLPASTSPRDEQTDLNPFMAPVELATRHRADLTGIIETPNEQAFAPESSTAAGNAGSSQSASVQEHDIDDATLADWDWAINLDDFDLEFPRQNMPGNWDETSE
ncbi:hypothetical protein EG329_005191 [Mollisiaceae sp. DMI_Dod_QoI]|nr:hypothetical protein EG329_005191 [Helotiales sp. DMI_Dod_QoI]